ncbi:26S protease regulatory subunit 6A like [Glycine soja]|nr:26S protease regulatory subunit 6A like [Glycine soja]
MLVGVYDHRRRRQRLRASRMLENGIRILKEEVQRSNREWESYKEKIKNNEEKVKLHKQLPYLVANIVEILDMNPEDEAEEDGANIDLDSQRKGKCVVLKTSTRQAMEVDEKPTEDYNDIGGLEKQIQEWVETIVLPITHKERFQKFGVGPPKGVLLYGPPGTGKTLIARACAAQTNATFLKLAGYKYALVLAKLVRDAFQLAKEKSPCIIFMDEIDAIGTKRFDSEVSGDRELQRTMLELLNQLDGFSSDDRVKIHSRKMNVHPDVNAAQLKAVCVEAGMLALCRDATEVNHEDFDEGIIQVQAKKKASLDYYA